MDFEAANRARDRRLRRRLLRSLNQSRVSPTGGIDGQTLMDLVDPVPSRGGQGGQGFEDGEHFIRLVRDLKNKQMAEIDISGMRVGQRLAPHHLHIRVTDKGSRLVNETEPPDPDIEDERVEVKS